jgi:hypothetical protein
MNALIRLSLTLALFAPSAGAVQQPWLPPEVAEGAAQQLAARLKQAGLAGDADDARLLSGARKMVAAMRADLEQRGESGLAALAPAFTGFELPAAGQRELDLMGRYNVCNLVLLRQLEDPAFSDDANARMTSTVGLTAVTLVIVYLREPFVAGGGDPGAIERHLTDPRLEPIATRIQTEAELLAAVEKSCQPVVTALLAGPLGER